MLNLVVCPLLCFLLTSAVYAESNDINDSREFENIVEVVDGMVRQYREMKHDTEAKNELFARDLLPIVLKTLDRKRSELPMSFLAKKNGYELPMSFLSRRNLPMTFLNGKKKDSLMQKKTTEDVPFAFFNKKTVPMFHLGKKDSFPLFHKLKKDSLPMSFLSKRTVDSNRSNNICKRALELCNGEIQKRATMKNTNTNAANAKDDKKTA